VNVKSMSLSANQPSLASTTQNASNAPSHPIYIFHNLSEDPW
jgi:hypothetical protein